MAQNAQARPQRIAVFMGGISHEREVSLMSGKGVCEALRSKGFDVTPYDPATDSVEMLEAGKFDAAFIALHGKLGEDGSIQGLCNCLGLPYTGPGVEASAIAMDKELTKVIWRAAGVPVPEGVRLERGVSEEEVASLAARFAKTGFVVKPDRDGSSIGVTKVQPESASAETLRAALELAFSQGEGALVEEYIHGREFTIALIDGKALPVIEIQAPEGSYDFQNKYYTDVTKYICPAEIPEAASAELRAACERAYRALGCRGWARVDALERPDGSFALLEINTSPGMTPHSLVPMAARAVGMDYASLCEALLKLARVD